MDRLNIAIIGFGNIGHVHKRCIERIGGLNLYAICDCNEKKLEELPANIIRYGNYKELLQNDKIDIVTVATPHWLHPEIGVDVLNSGKHLLMEKPIGVHKNHVQPLLETIKMHPELKAAAMFNQRTIQAHKKIKELLTSDELGKLMRINWTVTDWFRTQSYYDSGDWRASWRGEGGGVLINQCPHQLDLMQYFFGMPESVTAFAAMGKYHKIEVEDEVCAFLKYPEGYTAVFCTGTGEAPGVNRLEITADRGKLILEDKKIKFYRNETGAAEFCHDSNNLFGKPDCREMEIECSYDEDNMHYFIIENLYNAICKNEPLIANADEGIRGLELGNAMLLSALENRTVTLPIDGDLLEKHFEKLIAASVYKK